PMPDSSSRLPASDSRLGRRQQTATVSASTHWQVACGFRLEWTWLFLSMVLGWASSREIVTSGHGQSSVTIPDFHLLIRRANCFSFRHDTVPDLSGSMPLFLKPYQNRLPFGKQLTWQEWAERELSVQNTFASAPPSTSSTDPVM